MKHVSDDQIETLWEVSDVALFLKKTPDALYKMVERRQIPYIKISRRVYFDRDEIKKWLLKQTVKPVEVNYA